MTFDDYQESTMKTAVYRDTISDLLEPIVHYMPENGREAYEALQTVQDTLRRDYVGLGLGEAGEFQNKLKKVLRDGKGQLTDESRKKMGEELGGLLWYVAQCASELGLSLDAIAEENIRILKSRKERGVLQGSGDNR